MAPETITKKKTIRKLFKKFDKFLNRQGIIANKGNSIDASFVEVPRQRNTREENESIVNGVIPKDWKKKMINYVKKILKPDGLQRMENVILSIKTI